MALRGRRINNFLELWCLLASGGLDFLVSSTLLPSKPFIITRSNMRHPAWNGIKTETWSYTAPLSNLSTYDSIRWVQRRNQVCPLGLADFFIGLHTFSPPRPSPPGIFSPRLPWFALPPEHSPPGTFSPFKFLSLTPPWAFSPSKIWSLSPPGSFFPFEILALSPP